MFMETGSPGGPGGEPHYETCRSCKLLIAPEHKAEQISFDPSDEKLKDLNGWYHGPCAQPILSVKRAYDMLNRFRGF